MRIRTVRWKRGVPIWHLVNVSYRTLSDCLIAAEALDRYYRSGGTWLVHASCTTDNPNLHR